MKIRKRVKRIVFLILFLCLCIGSCMTSVSASVYHTVPTKTKKIALTFDDGPHPSQTERILDILDRYGVKATFFMIGVNVENYSDAAKEVVRRGHEIGNHTYHHSHLKNLGESQTSDEIEQCKDVLERVCGCRPHLFRPPEGYLNSDVLQCAEQGEYDLILWSVDTRDWECRNAGKISETVLSKIQAGDIVLMHDYVYKSKTPEALEIILPKLLALGFEPVTVGELLGIG